MAICACRRAQSPRCAPLAVRADFATAPRNLRTPLLPRAARALCLCTATTHSTALVRSPRSAQSLLFSPEDRGRASFLAQAMMPLASFSRAPLLGCALACRTDPCESHALRRQARSPAYSRRARASTANGKPQCDATGGRRRCHLPRCGAAAHSLPHTLAAPGAHPARADFGRGGGQAPTAADRSHSGADRPQIRARAARGPRRPPAPPAALRPALEGRAAAERRLLRRRQRSPYTTLRSPCQATRRARLVTQPQERRRLPNERGVRFVARGRQRGGLRGKRAVQRDVERA